LPFLDTNILLYSISNDSAEAVKREVALEILSAKDHVLSTQVLAEFYKNAVFPRDKQGVKPDVAKGLVEAFTRFKIHHVTPKIILDASGFHQRYKKQWWDSVLLCTAIDAGCTEVWTEDMGHGEKLGEIIVKNPFLEKIRKK
jgi:predicted nucleic acid-binding protein